MYNSTNYNQCVNIDDEGVENMSFGESAISRTLDTSSYSTMRASSGKNSSSQMVHN